MFPSYKNQSIDLPGFYMRTTLALNGFKSARDISSQSRNLTCLSTDSVYEILSVYRFRNEKSFIWDRLFIDNVWGWNCRHYLDLDLDICLGHILVTIFPVADWLFVCMFGMYACVRACVCARVCVCVCVRVRVCVRACVYVYVYRVCPSKLHWLDNIRFFYEFWITVVL